MPKTTNGQTYRIRYSSPNTKNNLIYVPRHRKNCLVTIEKGEGKDRYVYFGIARCKLSVDRFSKKEGRLLALSRAEEALIIPKVASFYLSEDGTKGYVHVRYVRSLLKHFESLDARE